MIRATAVRLGVSPVPKLDVRQTLDIFVSLRHTMYGNDKGLWEGITGIITMVTCDRMRT